MKLNELYANASKIAFENAKGLFEEAKILKTLEKNARAYALAILTFEELTKSFVYKCVSVGIMEEQKIRKFTLDHEDKLKHSALILFISNLIIDNYKEIMKALEHDKSKSNHKDHIFADVIINKITNSLEPAINLLKNAHKTKLDSLYVDVREGKIIEPTKIIDQKISSEIIVAVEKSFSFFGNHLSKNDDDFKKTVQDSFFSFLTELEREK